MLMKIDEAMESGGGESSGDSRGSLSPLPSHVSHRPKSQFSPGPPDNNSPLGPPTSLAAHHMINSLAASTAAKNMTPGLLASLSALNAMSSAAAAASFHHHDFGGSNSSFGGERGLDRHSYGSPPAPMAPTNDPTANECKLVDYRNQKVAAFVINGDTMLCLPQAFELFLKHLVGGLHTVYTKLKRLDIVPLVCNVEQVRILRGLGAIQPGVNRCKLLSCKDFDVLYKDCTTARPGRPPKRTSIPLVPLSQHSSHSQFMAIKKHRLENGDYGHYDNNHTNADLLRLEKSPLLANGYNHPPTQISQIPPMHLLPLGGGGSAAAAAAVAAHSALFSPSGIPHGLPHGHPRDCRSAPISSLNVARSAATWENCRTVYEDFVKHFESRYATEDCSDSDEKSSQAANEGPTADSFIIGNGTLSGGSPVLNLSKNTAVDVGSESEDGGGEEEEDYSGSEQGQRKSNYDGEGRGKDDLRKSPSPTAHGHLDNPHSTHYVPPGGIGLPETELSLTSNENLLRNIQGLLKVAADNAKTQERRVNLEKSELKMDAMRERELREQLEKELMEERNLRIYYEKRWKKERRFRKKLEDREDDDGSPRSRSGEGNPDSPQPHHYTPHLTTTTHKLNNNDRVKRSISPGEIQKSVHATNNGTTTTNTLVTPRDSSERKALCRPSSLVFT